jgi:hypothetical protein
MLHTFEDRTEPVSKLFEPLETADLLAHDPGCGFDGILPAVALREGGRGHSRSCCNRWQGSGHQGSSCLYS